MYYALKAHHRENFPNDIQGLMSDMREYGRIYQIFLDRDHYFLHHGDPQQLANLRLRVKDLVKIKFGVAKPFVLRCARDFEKASWIMKISTKFCKSLSATSCAEACAGNLPLRLLEFFILYTDS